MAKKLSVWLVWVVKYEANVAGQLFLDIVFHFVRNVWIGVKGMQGFNIVRNLILRKRPFRVVGETHKVINGSVEDRCHFHKSLRNRACPAFFIMIDCLLGHVVRGMVRVYKRPDLVRRYCSRFCPLGSEWQKCCQALKFLGLYDRMQLVVERMDTEEKAEKGTAIARDSDRTGVRGPR